MVQERATPEEPLEPPADDTPPPDEGGEPVAEPAAEPAPDQSASGRIAQAEYTKATQQNAAIKRELGLPKTATQAEVLAALAAATAAASASSDDDEDDGDDELTDREREAIERARAAELRVASAVYGEEFTTSAVEFINLVRTSEDLDEILTAAAAFRDTGLELSATGGDEGDGETDEDDADEGGSVVGTSEGDRAPVVQASSGGRRESGVVGALRGIFAAAGEERNRS